MEDTPLERLKAQLVRWGGVFGIHALNRHMLAMTAAAEDDEDEDAGGGGGAHHELTREALKEGLKQLALPCSMRDLEDLFTYFDKDRGGTISFAELVQFQYYGLPQYTIL